MPIQLTPEMLALAYDYLAVQKPFSSWNLPPSEDVKFSVSRHKDRFAHHQMVGGVHHLVFSSRFVGRHDSLLVTLAHELIHIHQEESCMMRDNPHDAAFHKLADKVCKLHEFDRLTF